MITASDRAALHDAELARARELLGILHHAAELKKEKCYTTTEGANGKPTKELRFVRNFISYISVDFELFFF